MPGEDGSDCRLARHQSSSCIRARRAPSARSARGLPPPGRGQPERRLWSLPRCGGAARGRTFLPCSPPPRSPRRGPARAVLSSGGARPARHLPPRLPRLQRRALRHDRRPRRAPRTTRTGSWTSSDDLGVAVEASVQTALDRHLGPVAAQPRLPRGPARRAAGRADLPLPPLAAAVRAAAQHDPRHLAAVDPGLRPVPGRAAAAGRQRARRHDQLADRRRDRLEPHDELLQRARGRAEPARRLRVRGRHRGRRVGPQPARSRRSRICGARRSRSPSSPPATTTCSTSSPGWSPPRSGTASALVVARRGQQSTSASSVPTTVSTVLVPMKNAARRSAGTALPATVSKLAASTATPAPTEAGANGTSLPLALGEQDEQQHGRRDRQREGGQEAGQRADPAAAAGELPRQHLAAVGARASAAARSRARARRRRGGRRRGARRGRRGGARGRRAGRRASRSAGGGGEARRRS